VKKSVRHNLKKGKARIRRRLAAARNGQARRKDRPTEFSANGTFYELAGRSDGIACGGIGAAHKLVKFLGLPAAIDDSLGIIKQPKPYSDSDHILNIVFNVLAGGRTLDDIEIRRNDSAFLDAIGARTIPDPTTAGDYCRRFSEEAVFQLMRIINEKRVEVWRRQPRAFKNEVARIDVDGSLVGTTGECKQGMGLSYNGVWGYHPLLVSLANTREPLFIRNRAGNRPSHEGAPALLDEAIDLCRQGGFQKILLRGDTDFSMTAHLDGWDADGVKFVFGYDATPKFKKHAAGLDDEEYRELERRADKAFSGVRRAKQARVKEQIVVERGYKNLRLVSEDVAEFEYKPIKASKAHRIVVVRKRVIEERGQKFIKEFFRYHFYITNDREMSMEQVVSEAMQRCNQENLIEQLKNGVHALKAPLNTLEANWAYMVIASLAWTLKAWFALHLPTSPRWQEKHDAERSLVLRMEFRTFLQQLMLIPAQILRTGRRTVYRLLGWRPQVHLLFRLLDAL
jgi:hypothetical protein